MKLVNYTIPENAYHEEHEIYYVDFTYDEELMFAKSILDNLTLIWLDLDDQKWFEFIFNMKSKYGKSLTFDAFEWYYEWMNRKDIEMPNFSEKGRTIRDSISGKHKHDFIIEHGVQIKRAWKEAWEMHPTIRKKGYEFFPSDNYEDSLPTGESLKIKVVEEQFQKEREFWIEVDKVQDECECTRSEAVTIVSDYKYRGNLPATEQIQDPLMT